MVDKNTAVKAPAVSGIASAIGTAANDAANPQTSPESASAASTTSASTTQASSTTKTTTTSTETLRASIQNTSKPLKRIVVSDYFDVTFGMPAITDSKDENYPVTIKLLTTGQLLGLDAGDKVSLASAYSILPEVLAFDEWLIESIGHEMRGRKTTIELSKFIREDSDDKTNTTGATPTPDPKSTGKGGTVDPPDKTSSYVYVTADGVLDEYGNNQLSIRLIKDGKEIATYQGICGSPNNQHLDQAKISGSYAPISPGTYTLSNLDDNNQVNFQGLGARIMDITPVEGRSGILFHLDANRATSAGTAGCLACITEADMKACYEFVRDNNITKLVIDYEKGWIDAP